MLEQVINLLTEANKDIKECPIEYISGQGLVKISKAIELLQDIQSGLRPESSLRFIVKHRKWYRAVPNQIFHRWDNAFKHAVMEMSLLYYNFNISLTKEAEDGTALQQTISACNGEAIITIDLC